MSISESYVSHPQGAPRSLASCVRSVVARVVEWAGAPGASVNAADLDPRLLRDMGLPPEVNAWNEREALRRQRNLREPHLW